MTMIRQFILSTLAICGALSCGQDLWGQIYNGPAVGAGNYGSYTSYFNKNVNNPGFRTLNPQEYERDKYIYQNPVLSPYLDLTNRREDVMPNYFSYVAPEERAQARQQQAQLSQPYSPELRARSAALNGADPLNGVGYTSNGPARMPTNEPYYHNHWYGNQNGAR